MISLRLKPVAIDHDGLHLHLDAVMNGQPVNLLIDTGASRTVIQPELLTSDPVIPADPDLTLESFGFGDTFDSFVATLSEINFYGVKIPDYEMAVFDLKPLNDMLESLGFPKTDGMLGGDLLKAAGAKLDYGRSVMILQGKEIPLEFFDPDDVGVEIVAAVEINGNRLWFFIDTGASKSVFDLAAVGRVFGISQDELIQNENASIGIDHHNLGMNLFNIRELKLGQVSVNNLQVATFDFANINKTYGELHIPAIAGIVGGDMLRQLGAVIDYETFVLMAEGS